MKEIHAIFPENLTYVQVERIPAPLVDNGVRQLGVRI